MGFRVLGSGPEELAQVVYKQPITSERACVCSQDLGFRAQGLGFGGIDLVIHVTNPKPYAL